MAVDLSDREWALLETASSAVPPPARPPAIGSDADYPDYITNLFLTVLDLQLHNVIVNNAILYYRKNGWDEVRTLADLETVLARFPDDTDGNRAAAGYLWGNGYGNRVVWLRGLVRWAREHDLFDQDRLREWAHSSDFRRDFLGRVKWLGISAYCWLVMRLGVDTVKPDVWLHAFVKRTLGRDLDDVALVEALTVAAHRIGRRARELDAAIWESERGRPGTI
jgi:hypothetical protein